MNENCDKNQINKMQVSSNVTESCTLEKVIENSQCRLFEPDSKKAKCSSIEPDSKKAKCSSIESDSKKIKFCITETNSNEVNCCSIESAFNSGKALIGFLTGGDPTPECSEKYILSMVKAGVDLIEIGIPFSDPIAEGEVIQRANIRALKAGTTTDKIFDMVANVRTKTDIPLVFLTYINPIFVYGADKFFEKCDQNNVRGVIIPDMPFEERGELEIYASKYNVDIITLIAPTSQERIKMLATSAKGFIYLVSSLGVTGVRSNIKTDLKTIIEEIRKVTKTKIAIGFGISTPEQAAEFSQMADGVIVGSAIVKIIEQYGKNASDALKQYIEKMKLQ